MPNTYKHPLQFVSSIIEFGFSLYIFCYQWRINVEMGVVIVTVESLVSSLMVFTSVWMVQVGIIWVSNPYKIQIQNESVCYCHWQTICSRTIVIQSMSRKQLCLQRTWQPSQFSQESPFPEHHALCMHVCIMQGIICCLTTLFHGISMYQWSTKSSSS